MKVMVIFDSVYGNTEKVAQAIAAGLTAIGDIRTARIADVAPSDLAGADLVVVGSPTHGGRPTPAIADFLAQIPRHSLKGVRVAAFDTRNSVGDRGTIIRLLASLNGYAAGRIAQKLTAIGGSLVAPAEGFYVIGREGPLEEGELDRASSWARAIAGQVKA